MLTALIRKYINKNGSNIAKFILKLLSYNNDKYSELLSATYMTPDKIIILTIKEFSIALVKPKKIFILYLSFHNSPLYVDNIIEIICLRYIFNKKYSSLTNYESNKIKQTKKDKKAEILRYLEEKMEYK